MRKTIVCSLAGLALAALAWAGGDPWKVKPYQQWDQKDLSVIMQTSPWAKVNITLAGEWHPMGSEAASSVQTTGSVGGAAGDNSHTSAGSLPGQNGGSSKAANAGPQVFNIYWWSSRTIREASVRKAELNGAATQADADKMLAQTPDSYQILIAGPNMALFESRGEKAFVDAAVLEAHKSKVKLTPTSVEFQKNAAGNVVGAVFNFPKKSASGEPNIAVDEKEVDFTLKLGPNSLRTYFTPKQMVDGTGADL
jgi:hypothetical protein